MKTVLVKPMNSLNWQFALSDCRTAVVARSGGGHRGAWCVWLGLPPQAAHRAGLGQPARPLVEVTGALGQAYSTIIALRPSGSGQ